MSDAAKQILDAALKLDLAERIHLAERIGESIQEHPAENVEQHWREERARRRKKIEAGQVRLFSIDQVRAAAQMLLRGR